MIELLSGKRGPSSVFPSGATMISETRVWPGRHLISVQFDIELVIDAGHLIGEKADPDKIALRVQQHHPEARLFDIRTMVLDTLKTAEPASAYCPPWGD